MRMADFRRASFVANLCLLAAMLPTTIAFAQGPDTQSIAMDPDTAHTIEKVASNSYLTSKEWALSIAVLLFGALVVTAEYLVIRSQRPGPAAVLKIFGITLIIIGTLFALTAGFSSEQIAPAMGLFGTVAGYLLGRAASAAAKGAKE
jgi:hypothetical protein